MHAAAPTAVTAHLFARAVIVGQPEPLTPPERTLLVEAECRVLEIAGEDRRQIIHPETRVLVACP
jgi:hypothetical protein